MSFGPVLPPDSSLVHLDLAGAIIYAALFVAVTIVTSRRPVLGVSVLILLDPFAFYRWIGFTTLTLPKVTLVAMIAGLLLRRVSWRSLDRAPVRMLFLAFLLMAAAAAISVWHAGVATPAIRETFKWFEYAAIFAVCAIAFHAEPEEAAIRWPALIATGLVISLALPELFVGATSGIIIAHTEIPRIAGPLEGPNQLAAYLGLTLPLLFAYTLRCGRRWPEIFAIAGGVAAVVLTFSRAGIVALLLALCVVAMFCFTAKLARALSALAALGILGGSAAAWWVLAAGLDFAPVQRHGIDLNGGLGTRRELWQAALQLWRAHPLWGIGAGNFELRVGSLLHSPIKTHANSLYLQSLVEGGLPLLAATIFLVYQSIASFVRSARTPLAIAALAASTGLAFHFVFDFLIFYPKVGMQWAILLGIAAASLMPQAANHN